MIDVVFLTPNWYKDLLFTGQDKMFIISSAEIVFSLSHKYLPMI